MAYNTDIYMCFVFCMAGYDSGISFLYSSRHGNGCGIAIAGKNNKTGGSKEMKKGKEKILKAMVKLAEAEVKVKDSYLYWPPRCIGYIYQPKRPKRNIEK